MLQAAGAIGGIVVGKYTVLSVRFCQFCFKQFNLLLYGSKTSTLASAKERKMLAFEIKVYRRRL